MDVFISWSGERSKYVAQRLHVWLRQVLQMVKPWMSSENILAGARWTAEIVAHLSTSKFGVICVTPENLSAPWLVFEAGALAKTIDEKTHVSPYLIGLDQIAHEEQKQTDTSGELLFLTRGIAQSASEIQAKMALPPQLPYLDMLMGRSSLKLTEDATRALGLERSKKSDETAPADP
jgi:hypothetical protein